MNYGFVSNKKGFTIIELMIAVSIFSLLILFSFSVINNVPKLVRTQSDQFSERTYVRHALDDITATIQNAKTVAIGEEIEFTMPNNEKIKYEFDNNSVNKVVQGTSSVSVSGLMDSIGSFSITAETNYLFDIYIKTNEEGKEYSFKVERRRGDEARTNAVISTITPDSVVFDKNVINQRDVDITLVLNENKLIGLRNGTDILDPLTDYSINGETVTIKKEYLALLPNGDINIIFNVSTGIDPKLSVSIIDASSNIKVAGNSYEDDIARMNYPGNIEIDPNDNNWTILVTNGTVSEHIGIADLALSGLPQGLNASAAKVSGNRIKITLSGSAVTPVSDSAAINIIIKGTAVTEPGALDSDSIEVLILAGSQYASPEHDILFTNELTINNGATITGDIVIGRNSSMTYIHNNSSIYGYVYVDSSLTVSNNATFGKPGKETKVFVKGSAIFHNNTDIYGDLYYRDDLVVNNKLKVTGATEKGSVDIPPVSLPYLMPDKWYEDNGYIIVPNSWTPVDLKDNQKYFFMTSYSFSNSISGLDNVVIAGKGNIEFTNNFSGSGILFAPNGKITFDNSCVFTGITISKSTVLHNKGTLTYKRYLELPFN
ncbi:MAG: X2-like carbohydrate binding domain-containing protein [Caulobacteraceae bacterium]